MGSPYVTFPGTSGRYAARADVNLLNADTAHVVQSAGQWTSLGSLSGGALIADVDAFGESTLRGTVGAAASLLTTPTTQVIPVSPSTQYSISMRVKASTAGTYLVRATTLNVSNTPLVNHDVTPTLVADTWTIVTQTITTHASATALYLRYGYTGSDKSGTTISIDTACLRTGATTTFVPSLRIVGDLDMRAHIAATDATPASAETIIGQRSGNSGYAMTLGTGGELVVYHGTGSGTRQETSSGLSLAAATPTVVRSTLDISAGTWTHYKDGVQFDSSGSFATSAGSPYAGPLAAGADSAGTSGNWDGDIYYAEVRDGIDGPVVARFDAADVLEAVLAA